MRKSDGVNYAKQWNFIAGMANDRYTWIARRIGIRGRMNSKFLLFWCKIIFILNIHYTSSLCMGLDIGIATYPQGDINIPYPGKPLEVFCTSESNYTSKDLYFHIGNKNLDSEIVNDTTIRLYVEQPEPQRFQLYCSTNSTKKHCLNKVLVDKPPIEVTDFKCISRNLETLNCSWTCPNTNTNMIYELSFFLYKKLLSHCRVERLDSTRYCVWNLTSIPMYRQQLEFYDFNLVSKNVFGTIEQNFTIDHFSVVKPDKPHNNTILEEPKPHSVKLFWEIPFNIVDFMRDGVEHKIEYQIAKQSGFHQVDATRLHPRKKNYTFNLTGLPYAHMSYEVRVFIKPKRAKDDQFWSESLNFFFKTASEIPQRPPDIAPGAFVASNFDTKRVVRVYWEQLEEYEKCGANFTYKVLVTENGRTQTISPDEGKSLSYVSINNASKNSIHISIQSHNNVGSSKNSSYLFIPATSQMMQGPNSFTKLAFENGTYELSWDTMDSQINNYTLFWCQYNYTQNCVGRMNFTTLESSKKSHVIELPIEKKYQFAIAVNRGDQTSGMVWAKCDISRDGVAMYAFPVPMGHGTAGKTHVIINWAMECTLREGIITGFNITYCPVIKDTIHCDTTVKNEFAYIKNPKAYSVNVTNLLPFRTYRFNLSINTVYGLKLTNETTYVTTLADVPSEPVNVKVTNITSESLVISWDPPLKKNGNIVRYQILNYSNLTTTDLVPNLLTDVSRRSFNLKGLSGFTNYSLSVVACNSADTSLCSKPTAPVLVRTSIGPPSKIEGVVFEHNILTWKKPKVPGGIVDRYEIKRVKDQEYTEIYKTTDLFFNFIACDEAKATDEFQVRAVNLDSHSTHGAYSDSPNVELPIVSEQEQTLIEYAGEWSIIQPTYCQSGKTFNMIVIFMALFIGVIGMGLGSLKLYKKYRKMEDIEPVLPLGLGVTEKENPKFSYKWNVSNEAKVTDEDLLLPTKAVTQSNTTIKQDSNGSSDNTDSTTFSHSSLENQEQEASTSDEGSTSSLHLDLEPIKAKDDRVQECVSDPETASNTSTIVQFNKNPTSGYIQPTAIPAKGYIQPSAAPQMPIINLPLKPPPQPTTSSYVMAGLSGAPIFTAGSPVPAPMGGSPMVGYVHPDDIQIQPPILNFPALGLSSTNVNSPESLPSMPTLPPAKGSDSSYIQLQSLEALPTSLKPAIRNSVPLKPPTSGGYVSPADVVVNKRFNILVGRNHGEDPVLDPTMSPDAYCRFSWSADPSKDNLTAILAESTAADSQKQ